jgi:drug/metabolite transporter superfamily protein YnfA
MPRGLYQVKVKTRAGIPMQVPVSLSKNQDMQLKVISYADVGGSFLVFALISIVLVTARRPALRDAIRRQVARLGGRVRRMEVRR